jgi:hypothetical protein
MKKLSRKILAIALMLGSLGIYSCTKETGPKGDPGVNGTNGTNGVNGNANVTQISFGSKAIPPSGILTLTLPGITKSIADKSLILTYGLRAGAGWFSLTGYWINNALTKTYISRIFSQDPASAVHFEQLTGPATSETFDDIRVLVIPANVLVNGRSAKPPYDITDYESVRQYFNLPK